MTRTYVFVDVETTGLNPRKDMLIEVAAIVWRDGEVVDSVSSLVDPGRDIPAEITQLTGITNRMVKGQPSAEQLSTGLNEVIGDAIIVGHNIDFDLGFLHEIGVGWGNHRLDTLTLASILLPLAGRYGLQSLVHHLHLPESVAHRAEADAYHTLNLYLKLEEVAAELDFVILNEIITAGQKISWPETLFFEQFLGERVRNAVVSGEGGGMTMTGSSLFSPERPEGQTLTPVDDEESLQPIDVEMVKGMLKQGSNFSRVFPNYEPRKEQVQMVSAVAGALNKHRHLMVEAGTGTGKSLAYLLPAAFWAHQNDRRVVVSTNTINLQDQLIHKDIPALKATLPFEIQAAVRKGKSNYLCMRAFKQMRHRGPKDKDEMALYSRLLMWLPQTKTGDKAEISIRTPGEQAAWRKLSGENARCSRADCSTERCPLHYARRRAELAHIVIVNHALLLADADTQNHILPEYRDLIVDEGHHLEAAVTNGMSFSADQRFLVTQIEQLTDSKQGVLIDLAKNMRELSPNIQDELRSYSQGVVDKAQLADIRLQELFETLRYFLADKIFPKSEFSQSIRLVPSVRETADFQLVRDSWQNLNLQLSTISERLSDLAKGVSNLLEENDQIYDGEEMVMALGDLHKGIEDTRKNLDAILDTYSPEMITWIEIWRDRISLHAAPLHVGDLVETHLWDKLESVIVTSATLRTAPQGYARTANFDYVRTRLNAGEKVHELAVGSPFDYKANTLLYLCTDMPEPKQPGYQRGVERAIIDVAKTLGGRTIVLFTSYRQLRETARSIRPDLKEHKVEVLEQRPGMSRQALTAQFKEEGARAVLLGTSSFWEGVDVPGPALEAVMLVKLPFDVPSDPIIGARSETFDNPFFEYAIPEAVLKFRQGFGRLNRRKSDEGIVVVLDKRVLTKRYGELFVKALPESTMLRQRTGRLPEIIKRWQNRKRD